MTAFIHATGIVTRVRKISTQKGTPMTVATLETGQNGGQRMFFSLKAFDDHADKLADIRDGSVLSVQGEFSESSYEKDGQTRWAKNIKVNAILAGFVPQTNAPELEGAR